MRIKPISSSLAMFAVIAAGASCAWAEPAGQELRPVLLTERGKVLEARYTEQLLKLKAEIIAALPTVNDRRKTSFLVACEKEVEAKEQIEAARQRMGEMKSAKALVEHAKGKWIGGADKGIAVAKEALKRAPTATERRTAKEQLVKWEENRAAGVQALEERQAKLDKVEREGSKVEKQVKEAAEALAEARVETLQAVKDLGLESKLSSDALDGMLAKYATILDATPRGLAAFAEQSEMQWRLIDRLLAAEDLLIQIAVADGAKDGKYGRAMQIYQDIWNASENVAQGPLRRLALAISLEHAVPIKQRNAVAMSDAPEFVDPVKRYLHFEKALIDGELDPAFKDLSTWDYRMVVNGEEPDEILTWGRRMLRNYRPDHITTIDYRWRYVAIVRSDIRYGSQDNKYDKDELQFFQNILMNGGVCGRRAFFGRFILRAFGIPTTARPQRGHAALVRWTPDGWVPCLGAGWGSGWTKTRYDRDLDFLANTQARALGDSFMQVKRAQWIGDVMGEPQIFGFLSKGARGFWYGVSLYTQRVLIEESQARTLAAVGEDIGEANESREKVEIAKVRVTEEDREISLDREGVIMIPAVATSEPVKSTGKIIFMNSYLGGKQLHYSRTGGHQTFEYTLDAPASGRYELTARVVTPSWKQSLLLQVNENREPVEMVLPFTVGMWDKTKSVEVELVKGRNVLRFSREGEVKGVAIKDFTLTPVPDHASLVPKVRGTQVGR